MNQLLPHSRRFRHMVQSHASPMWLCIWITWDYAGNALLSSLGEGLEVCLYNKHLGDGRAGLMKYISKRIRCKDLLESVMNSHNRGPLNLGEWRQLDCHLDLRPRKDAAEQSPLSQDTQFPSDANPDVGIQENKERETLSVGWTFALLCSFQG